MTSDLTAMTYMWRRTLKLPLRYSIGRPAVFCLFVFLFAGSANTQVAPNGRIITVNVNAAGIITIGRDTVSSDDLAPYIRQRLFKSYTGTGKMYDAIRLAPESELAPVVLDVIRKEIGNGLQRALTELCLEKYKKLYEDLNANQQRKLKKNFKILFQTNYE